MRVEREDGQDLGPGIASPRNLEEKMEPTKEAAKEQLDKIAGKRIVSLNPSEESN